MIGGRRNNLNMGVSVKEVYHRGGVWRSDDRCVSIQL